MAITITNLLKKFVSSDKSRNALDHITTEPGLPVNDITIVVGKNGSGKSTLLNCIGGLLPIDGGKLTVDIPNAGLNYTLAFDNPAIIPKEARRKIGHIFQQKALWNHFSVWDNIVHPLRSIHHLSASEAANRAKVYLGRFDIGREHFKKYPNQLSGGQQRKVAIARTFAMEPDLLLIDELEANLDQSALKLVMAALRDYLDHGKTVLMISHSIELLEPFIPTIVLLHEGKIVETATGAMEFFLRSDNSANGKIVRASIDFASRRWFLANQSLEIAKRISAVNVDERNINLKLVKIGQEIANLISHFSPEGKHLLLIATKSTAPSAGSTEVNVRFAAKSEGFILNGSEADRLGKLVLRHSLEDYDFVSDHLRLFESGGINLLRKPENNALREADSLIGLMFDEQYTFEKKLNFFNYKYDLKRHPEMDGVRGAYNTRVTEPEGWSQIEKDSYYQFSKGTRNVYLIACLIDKSVKGMISIDTCDEDKWPEFVIQQLILIGNLVAISIKDHELQMHHSKRPVPPTSAPTGTVGDKM